MSAKPRSDLKWPIFEGTKSINFAILAKYEGMIRYFDWVEHKLKAVSTNIQITTTEAGAVVGQKIKYIWRKFSTPTVLQSSIITRIKSLLFNVTACKCPDLSACICEKVFKIPAAERAFLQDQRSIRNMIVDYVDVQQTNT